jgi:hypothetical protein
VLTYLHGTVPNDEPWPDYVWSDRTLADIGHWLRRYHETVAGYRPDETSRWWYRDGGPREGEIVCHNDLAPYNTVFVDERVAGSSTGTSLVPLGRRGTWRSAHGPGSHCIIPTSRGRSVAQAKTLRLIASEHSVPRTAPGILPRSCRW